MKSKNNSETKRKNNSEINWQANDVNALISFGMFFCLDDIEKNTFFSVFLLPRNRIVFFFIRSPLVFFSIFIEINCEKFSSLHVNICDFLKK